MKKLTNRQFLNMQSINAFSVVMTKRSMVNYAEKEMHDVIRLKKLQESRLRRLKKILRNRRRSILAIKVLDFISERLTKALFQNRLKRIEYCESLVESIEYDLLPEYENMANEYAEMIKDMEKNNLQSYNFITQHEVDLVPQKIEGFPE